MRSPTGHNAGDLQTPPIYAPQRITRTANGAPERNVYLIVHALEYQQYKTALRDYPVKVIGWRFPKPAADSNFELVGFGATRFAALAFCRHLKAELNQLAPAADLDKVWIIDDNVIGIRGFPGFGDVEAGLGNHTAVGFKGAGVATSSADNQRWASRRDNRARNARSNSNLILQQVVLWNLNHLDANDLNFGAAFLDSNEDYAFIQALNYWYQGNNQYYEGARVVKELTSYDDSAGARQLLKLRSRLRHYLSSLESSGRAQPDSVPPPVSVIPGNGPAQNIKPALKDHFSQSAPPWLRAGDGLAKASVQAVEQIARIAIRGLHQRQTDTFISRMNQTAMDCTFKNHFGLVQGAEVITQNTGGV